jgi:hypothetical protein
VPLEAAIAPAGKEREPTPGTASTGWNGGGTVTRALKSHNLWLTLGYISLILLLAKAYS